MGRDRREISGYCRALQLHGVNERKKVGYLFECAAHKFEIEPYAGKPGGKVGKKRSANSANLFIRKNASKKETKPNLKKRDRK